MTGEEVSHFEKVHLQLQGMYDEVAALAKKNPDNALNKFKLNFINQVIQECISILGTDYLPFPDFSTFEEDSLPTTSDVTFILSQYLNCMDTLRADNVEFTHGKWYWVIDRGLSDIPTAPPKKVRD